MTDLTKDKLEELMREGQEACRAFKQQTRGMHTLPDSLVIRAENERLHLRIEVLCGERDEAQMNEAALRNEVRRLEGLLADAHAYQAELEYRCFRTESVSEEE